MLKHVESNIYIRSEHIVELYVVSGAAEENLFNKRVHYSVDSGVTFINIILCSSL